MTIFPPARYAAVEDDVYRGGYPMPRNQTFLARLKLKTIVLLTPSPPTPALAAFASLHTIGLIHIRVDKHKESIPISFNKVIAALLLLIDESLHPIYFGDLDGAVMVSVVAMCLRKLCGWPSAAILSEASRFLKDEECVEEMDFLARFTGDFEIPMSISVPKW